MSTSSSQRTLQQLRPNGSQAACDPCRARKVACDHARPACSRCRAKNRTSQCSYSANVTRRLRPKDNRASQTDEGQPAILTPPASKRSRPNMRLGYTSSLEETQTSLLSTAQSSIYGHISPIPETSQNQQINFGQLPLPIRETCLSVLRALPCQRDAQMRYIDGDFRPRGWVHLAAHRILKWLQTALVPSAPESEEEALSRVAQQISENTSTPMRGPYADWDSWMNSFVDSNTRWESIGLLWTHMECVSDILDALIPRKLVRSENNTSSHTAKLYLDGCIRLTRHFTDESDLLADVYRRRAILISLTDGESGKSRDSTSDIASYLCMLNF